MRILIGALFVLLASSASAQANWYVGHGATGANSAIVKTTRSGVTYEVGLYCYDPDTVYMYIKGFPYPTNPGVVANIYIDGISRYGVNMAVGAGGVPNGFPREDGVLHRREVPVELQVGLHEGDGGVHPLLPGVDRARAVGGDRDRAHFAIEPTRLQRTDQLTGGHVPDRHRAVLR